MKKYTVELRKTVTITDIEAENGSAAAMLAHSIAYSDGSSYEVRSVVDQDKEEEVIPCEVCGGDIYPDEAYTTSEDDGYSVCEKCSKGVQDEG